MNDPTPGPHEPAAATLQIDRYPETLALVRLGPGAEIPTWAESSSLFSVTATATETSLICAGRDVPGKARAHRPLTGFAVRGAGPAGAVRVLGELLPPLAAQQVDAFVLSTYDIEWVLVPKNDADRVAEAWRRQGHQVAPAVPVDPRTPRGRKK